MKWFRWLMVLAVGISITASPPTASAAGKHVVISELQTGTASSSSQEFVELYNPTSSDISLSGWTIEYKSATSIDSPGNWVKHASLSGAIKSYGFYLIAPKTYLSNADSDWSATLAAAGGNIRLRDGSGATVDQVGYGSSANAAEGLAPAVAPAASHSIEREPGRLDELSGNGSDADNNSEDFIERADPQPQNSQSPIEPPVDAQPIFNEDSADDSSQPAQQAYLPLQLTELFVDPLAPLMDSNDEFIEIYNPNDNDVDLKGYAVKAGTNFHAYFVLPSIQLASHSFVAIYSSQSHLGLTNTGGSAEILDPSGAVIDVADTYGVALPGQSWARFPDGWHWTTNPTPGSENQLSAALPIATVRSLVKQPTVVKRATTAHKAPAPKTQKPKATKPTAAKTAKPKSPTYVAAARNMKPASWLLILLAVLTISYATYEFRYDIYNLYAKFSRYPKAGGAPGQGTERGSGD